MRRYVSILSAAVREPKRGRSENPWRSNVTDAYDPPVGERKTVGIEGHQPEKGSGHPSSGDGGRRVLPGFPDAAGAC